ncbi:MAG: 50S ribosome-binding GTPase [Acidobacteria bacterium]|nr:50S ribosome-binding GTPase [Acidobacteriota bacterium]
MPANLTPEYMDAERDYKSAATQAEKVAALERMLSTLPKHKGTEKMQADIRRRLSQARKDAQKKGAHHAAPFYQIEKEGAGQVALAGPPNAGKSQLVCALTHAVPEVADYPFTTRMPTPGMMQFEDVQIQLIDLPPMSPEFMEPWLPQALRAAHLSVLVVDPSDAAVLEQIEFIGSVFEARRIPPPKLLIGNKLDLPGAAGDFAALAELYRGRFPLLAVSALTGEGLERFRRALFDALDLVRVYTKAPGHKFEPGAPYILKRGKTVEEAAAAVHKDFAERLKFARLFRLSGDRDGLMVERSHVVEDRDILEFHI